MKFGQLANKTINEDMLESARRNMLETSRTGNSTMLGIETRHYLKLLKLYRLSLSAVPRWLQEAK